MPNSTSGGGISINVTRSSSELLATQIGAAAALLRAEDETSAGELLAAVLPTRPAALTALMATCLILVILGALLALYDVVRGLIRAIRNVTSPIGHSSYLNSKATRWRPLYSTMALIALASQATSLIMQFSSAGSYYNKAADALAFAASGVALCLLCATIVPRGVTAMKRASLYAATTLGAVASAGLSILGLLDQQKTWTAVLSSVSSLLNKVPAPCADDDDECGPSAIAARLLSAAHSATHMDAYHAAVLTILVLMLFLVSTYAQQACVWQLSETQGEQIGEAKLTSFCVLQGPRQARTREARHWNDEPLLRRGDSISSRASSFDEWLSEKGGFDAKSLSHADLRHLEFGWKASETGSSVSFPSRRGSSTAGSTDGLKLDTSDALGATLAAKFGSAEDYVQVPKLSYFNHHDRDTASNSSLSRSGTLCSARSQRTAPDILDDIPVAPAGWAPQGASAISPGTQARELQQRRRRLRVDLTLALLALGLMSLFLALKFAAGDDLSLGLKPMLDLVERSSTALVLTIAHTGCLIALMSRGSGMSLSGPVQHASDQMA